MSGLLFGTAGIPFSTPGSTTLDGIHHIRALGLDALEIEFVRQVYLNAESARAVAIAARDSSVTLSVHAPYYINLNAVEPQKRRASQAAVYRSASIGAIAGAYGVVFHPGYYLKSSPGETFDTIQKYTTEVEDKLAEEGLCIKLLPETTGKLSQFGNLEETLALCKSCRSALPCIDFAHLHAYQGKVNTYEEFSAVLETIKDYLGPEALQQMHLHVSGIHYGHRGELKHLPLVQSDFNYTHLLQALIDYRAGGRLICESPNLEEDALLLQQTYRQLQRR